MTNKERLKNLNNNDFNNDLNSIVYGCNHCPNRNKKTDTFKNECNCAKEFFKWLEMECETDD